MKVMETMKGMNGQSINDHNVRGSIFMYIAMVVDCVERK